MQKTKVGLALAALALVGCGAVRQAGPCSIGGFVYVDTNGNGLRESWKGETDVVNGATVRLSTGKEKQTEYGWYAFGLATEGKYTVTLDIPAGYTPTSPTSLAVMCQGERKDVHFGLQASNAPTPTPTPTPMPTPTPAIVLPSKMGLAVANDVTLDVAQRLGADRVLLYWGTPALVNEALARGLSPIVGVSDCNLTPARYQQISTVARDHPGLIWMWLNEPDMKGQAGGSCGAQADPYDASYDLTRAVRQFSAVSGMIWANDPSARLVYGNEAVALGQWHTRFEQTWAGLYGDLGRQNVLLGWHIYPAWWLGQTPNSFGGWRDRLQGALAHSSGPVIITEVGAQDATDPVSLFEYLVALFDAEPRVEAAYWISWGNATVLDASGNVTALGHALSEEMTR